MPELISHALLLAASYDCWTWLFFSRQFQEQPQYSGAGDPISHPKQVNGETKLESDGVVRRVKNQLALHKTPGPKMGPTWVQILTNTV